MWEELVAALQQILESDGRGALATVLRAAGSTPQRPGARMLLLPDGHTLGTVGGGALEQVVLEALARVRAGGEAELVTRELGYDLGMCCGGRMEVLVEPVAAQPKLLLCGAGHVAAATAPLARSVGFRVTVIDEREELNSEARFADCVRELIDPAAFLRRTPPSAADYVLIATHDHALDERVLERALASPARYIGLMGSKRKVFRLLERIAQRGGAHELARLFAPVGLDLGALGPEEIAVSIVAELVALRRQKSACHMRVVDEPRFAKRLGDQEP